MESGTQAARCTPVPCLPDCAGKTCGQDGCGGSCGECRTGELCDAGLGVCLPDGPGCGEIPPQGVCLDHVLAWCEGEEVKIERCLEAGQGCVQADGGLGAACCPVVTGALPCRGVPASGHCEAGHLFACEAGALAVEHCSWQGFANCTRVSLDRLDCYWSRSVDPARQIP